ncbi:mucoidy inhibitor a [Moniliophthora roreri]|nr:mucoidy inhibitor a [Moniliophthora roreri]
MGASAAQRRQPARFFVGWVEGGNLNPRLDFTNRILPRSQIQTLYLLPRIEMIDMVLRGEEGRLHCHEVSSFSHEPSEVVTASAGPDVKVAKGVVAQWDGVDDSSVDAAALGKNRKIK